MYAFVVFDVALLPRIAAPPNDTRAFVWAGMTAVRLRTERADAAPVPRDTTAFDVPVRDTTLRDAPVLRDATAPVVPARDTTLRDVAVRATFAVFDCAWRGLVRALRDDAPARKACGLVASDTLTGAIGSAKTARIDNNVEQTKNAPASKNTVPTAFLQQSAIFWRFIKLSCIPRKGAETQCFLAKTHYAFAYILIFIITF